MLLENNTLTLQLPDEMIGKTVEVIAFEIEEPSSVLKTATSVEYDIDTELRLSKLNESLAEYTINSGGYKFDRDDANEYD